MKKEEINEEGRDNQDPYWYYLT